MRFVLAAPPQTAAPLTVFMQIPRMVLYLENVLGLAQPLRTQMRPVGVFLAVFCKERGLAADDRHDRPHPSLPQQRIGIDIVIIVAVVKGQHDRLCRKRRAVPRIRDEIAYRHRLAAARPERIEVAREHLGRDHIFSLPRAVLQDAVIHDDRERPALLGKYRPHPLLPQQADAEAQREQRARHLHRCTSKAVFQEKSPPRAPVITDYAREGETMKLFQFLARNHAFERILKKNRALWAYFFFPCIKTEVHAPGFYEFAAQILFNARCRAKNAPENAFSADCRLNPSCTSRRPRYRGCRQPSPAKR